jgi:hypothetical protein
MPSIGIWPVCEWAIGTGVSADGAGLAGTVGARFFAAGFVSGIGIVMPGICWCWATAGAAAKASASALAVMSKLFTLFLR